MADHEKDSHHHINGTMNPNYASNYTSNYPQGSTSNNHHNLDGSLNPNYMPNYAQGSTSEDSTRQGAGGFLHDDIPADQALRRIKTAGSINISPELFEKLYLSPQNKVSGDLRKTFANPTPLALLGFVSLFFPA